MLASDLSHYLTRYSKQKVGCLDPLDFRRAYLSDCSPWRDSLSLEAHSADVLLGVDPGTFFCGGLVRFLAELGAAFDIPTGFIHVPPDARSVEGPNSLLPPAVFGDFLLELLNRILCTLNTFRKDGQIKVLLWGFGEFGVIQSNPVERFLCEGSNALLSAGLLKGNAILVSYPNWSNSLVFYPLVFKLAESAEFARRGNYFVTMEHIYQQAEIQFACYGVPDVIVGLGVDASQLTKPFSKPTFIVELQAQGFYCEGGGTSDRYFNSFYTINCSLVPHLVEGSVLRKSTRANLVSA